MEVVPEYMVRKILLSILTFVNYFTVGGGGGGYLGGNPSVGGIINLF